MILATNKGQSSLQKFYDPNKWFLDVAARRFEQREIAVNISDPRFTIVNRRNKNRHKTIFVSIPSYRDPECQYTIQNLFQTATFPERIFVGVCMQYDRVADTNCFVLPLSVPTKFVCYTWIIAMQRDLAMLVLW